MKEGLAVEQERIGDVEEVEQTSRYGRGSRIDGR